MSDFMRRLRAGARQVQKLHKDLHSPTLARRAWNENVFARQTLGEEVEIELWYLAEHFLLAWHDWHGLSERYSTYFGEPEHPLPATWRRLDANCTVLAGQLLRNVQLDDLISSYWLTTGVLYGDRQRKLPSLDEIYQMVVQNHRRWLLLQEAASGRLAFHATLEQEIVPTGEVWPQCCRLISRLNDETLSACKHFMEVVGQDLCVHLRHYRHATLLLSWLVEPGVGDILREGDGRGDGSGYGYGDRAGDGQGQGGSQQRMTFAGRSALLQILSEKVVIPSIEQFLRELKDDNLRGTASHVLGRITEAIGEIGYEDFVADVIDGDFRGGPGSLVGASAVNVIPSPHRGKCHDVLLAVSRGDKKAIGFPAVMREVREHLIRCPVTQAVIVLCDSWGPSMLDEHIGDLRAHHARSDRPVRFLFLMVGTPGRIVSPVAVDLGLAP